MVTSEKLLANSPLLIQDKQSTTSVVPKQRSFMSEKSDPLPIKYCKYHLFNKCRHTQGQCHHTHDIKQAKVISCRKMNASNPDIDRMINIIKDNPQV